MQKIKENIARSIKRTKGKAMKRIVAAVITAALAVTLLSDGAPAIEADVNLGTVGTYTGEGAYISTTYAKDYYAQGDAFEITFRYDVVDTSRAVGNEVLGVDFNDTLEYVVFDDSSNGWQKTIVGPNGYDKEGAVVTPRDGDQFTVRIPIREMEGKYEADGGTGDILGINLQIGEIGDSKITIVSQKIVGTFSQMGKEFTATGSWTKGIGGTMTLDSKSKGNAVVSTNEWNIAAKFSVKGFTNPTVDVTVNYTTISKNHVQAEILINNDTPVVPNYVIPRQTGEMTYTTELPQGTTSFLACYDQCEIKAIHVYDNTEEERPAVTGRTAAETNANLNPSWNLGNALEAVNSAGNVDERAWGNPPVTQKTFQAVKAAGFNSVRIPVSYLNKVDANGNIDKTYLARIEDVVRKAINSGLYVVIDIHHDGGENIAGKWLDISKTGTEFDAIKAKFQNMWSQIAAEFAKYDQRLVFESMSELMISGSYTYASPQAYANINALNQAFVDAVRNAGGKNADRCLIVRGYNADIDLTVQNYGEANGFKVPTDVTANRLILSVSFFDPYDFTLNENSSKTSLTVAELNNIGTQFAKIKSVSTLPIYISEYSVIDKDNLADRVEYLQEVKMQAAARGITCAYWDNGSYRRGGSAIFDRQSNGVISFSLLNATK